MTAVRMPPQLLRLVLLACGIGASYAVARVLLTPPSFGRYGHYRGAALEEIAAREPTFAGAVACDECHSEVRDTLVKHDHKANACESCHGPTRRHAEDPDVKTAVLSNATCLRCHGDAPGQPSWFKHVKESDHYTGDKCIECHSPHNPKDMK